MTLNDPTTVDYTLSFAAKFYAVIPTHKRNLMTVSSLRQLFTDAKGNPTIKLTLPNHLEVTKITLCHQKSLKMKP